MDDDLTGIWVTYKKTNDDNLRNILILVMRTLAVAGLVIGIGRPIAGGWLEMTLPDIEPR